MLETFPVEVTSLRDQNFLNISITIINTYKHFDNTYFSSVFIKNMKKGTLKLNSVSNLMLHPSGKMI